MDEGREGWLAGGCCSNTTPTKPNNGEWIANLMCMIFVVSRFKVRSKDKNIKDVT
jgi:hypothetical protein